MCACLLVFEFILKSTHRILDQGNQCCSTWLGSFRLNNLIETHTGTGQPVLDNPSLRSTFQLTLGYLKMTINQPSQMESRPYHPKVHFVPESQNRWQQKRYTQKLSTPILIYLKQDTNYKSSVTQVNFRPLLTHKCIRARYKALSTTHLPSHNFSPSVIQKLP